MMRTLFSLSCLFLAFLVLPAGLPAHGAPLVSLEASHSRMHVYSEVSEPAAGERFWLAVAFEPQEHWHTYWINPGDSGAAPIIEWALPTGVSISAPSFGVPQALPFGPLMNYGYEGTSYLLYEVSVGDAFEGNRLPLAGEAEWLVCEQECIPQFDSVSVGLPLGSGALDGANADTFAAARAGLPEPAYWEAELRVSVDESTLVVFMDKAEAETVTAARFFPEQEGVTDYAATQSFRITDEGLAINLPRYTGAPLPRHGHGILTLDQEGFALAVEIKASAVDAGMVQSAQATQASPLPIWQAAVFAFLGGIILNLMPCVFPVLSLKAMSFVRAGDGDAADMRREGWAYTFGILVSFALLVGVLVALRASGAAVGWGFQLQEPLFVAGLVMVMVLVGLSLSGMFEISTGLEGSGQSLAAQDGTKGAFFTGVLATLVATPCTAPLMAPAIGFALAQPVYVIALVFSMLAFGLAFPFLLLSYSRTVARWLPRPGAWMETFKQALAFPLYATAIWLLSVFAAQAGMWGVTALLATVLVLVFAIWLAQKGARLAKISALALALGAVVVFVQQPLETDAPTAGPDAASETAWSPERLAALQASGEPVFVYFTADWCITCKFNERVALFVEETESLFSARGIKLLKGDWTNKNAEIAAVLAAHGRAGVPLYLFYAPGVEEPVVLPEILSPAIIRDAIS